MKTLTAALATIALLSPCAFAQQEGEVKRGPIERRAPASGTVVFEDVFRLKSSIEGRIEAVLASSYTWAGPESPVALLADQKMAALIDNRNTTPTEVLEERWKGTMQPAQVRCMEDCFILTVFARPKKRVLPQAVLFEAAHTVKLVGHIANQHLGWVQEGQTVWFWSPTDPSERHHVIVNTFVVDNPGKKTEAGGTFTARCNREQYLDPGSPWVGYVVVEKRKTALVVPTSALFQWGDSVYLPVKVSTGATNEDFTEITTGIEGGRRILVPKSGAMGSARPHGPEAAPPPPPKAYFDLTQPGGNRALDDSPYDKPENDDE
ncbi:MAG: hypothetical protein NTX64_18685 [Elusimicrobia bacterium]|nr:hypothetical protein [Elusimicrobiota bacterium]